MKKSATGHRWLGALLLLPLLGWCLSGSIFLFKPNYGDAYSPLPVRAYALQGLDITRPQESWQEYRVLRSILGVHLLVRKASGWRQLDNTKLTPASLPSDADVIRLLEDAITMNPERYGQRVAKLGNLFISETGVRLSLDWSTMSLKQHGRDRELIDQLYNVHYLRWTGHDRIDRAWAIIALGALLLSTLLGARLLLHKKKA